MASVFPKSVKETLMKIENNIEKERIVILKNFFFKEDVERKKLNKVRE